MIKNRSYLLVVFLMTILLLTGCSNNQSEEELAKKDEEISQLNAKVEELNNKIKDLEQKLEEADNMEKYKNNEVLLRAIEAVNYLKNKDMEGLASVVHPLMGVRFTPYEYIDLQNDLVFTKDRIATFLEDTQNYTWGSFDGSGEPIIMTFSEYFDRFIYDVDFANAQMIGNNYSIGKGNSQNNISEAYPDAYYIEFHFPGFEPEYEGMDWRSLRLVYEKMDGVWYLVGIVHGEWTI
jgi:outer membrane murein-binding lipoprotein Lpp